MIYCACVSEILCMSVRKSLLSEEITFSSNLELKSMHGRALFFCLPHLMFYLKLQTKVLHGNINMGVASNATSLFAQGVTDEKDNEELI